MGCASFSLLFIMPILEKKCLFVFSSVAETCYLFSHALSSFARDMAPRRAVPARPPVPGQSPGPSGRNSALGRVVAPRRPAHGAATLAVFPVGPAIALVRKRKRMFCSTCPPVNSIRQLLVARPYFLCVLSLLYIHRRWLLSFSFFY